jgi:hypothetical protein
MANSRRDTAFRYVVPLRRSTQKFVSLETRWPTKASFVGQQYAGFILREVLMRVLITAAISSALALAPASAAKMAACTGENMAKTTTMMVTMPDGPGKMAMGKEMGMANTEMSKGNMRGACMHYMKAQKMSAAK